MQLDEVPPLERPRIRSLADDRWRMSLFALPTKFFEWTGCALSLGGATILALDTAVSRYGWIAFFGANIAAAIFARRIRANGLMLQQIGFLGTSTLGIFRAFWPHF